MIKSLAILSVLALGFLFPQPTPQNGNRAIRDEDKKAIVLAIEDEIYDWGCQTHVEFVGKEVAHEKYDLLVYINPLLKDGRGEIIYKFMPMGEIYRSFSIGKSGTAYLLDDPWLGFGPERPSYNTLYMDDADLCRFKSTWIKTTFTIEFRPGKARIQEAIERQKRRLDEDYRSHDRNCSVNGS